MAFSHLAGRQKRALTRYTLFVVWELFKLPLSRHPQTEYFCTRATFLFAIFPNKTYNAEALSCRTRFDISPRVFARPKTARENWYCAVALITIFPYH